MCGVAGYIGLPAERGEPLLRILADAQAHRGPDGVGYFVHGAVGLAHRRLAVIDRLGGVQPFRRGPYVLIYNGVVYNFRELREELRGWDRRFGPAATPRWLRPRGRSGEPRRWTGSTGCSRWR